MLHPFRYNKQFPFAEMDIPVTKFDSDLTLDDEEKIICIRVRMPVELALEFGAFDGFWLKLVVPVVSILVFVLLSPLSFWIHKLLSK